MLRWYEAEALLRNHQQEVARWVVERRLVKLAARPLRERFGRWMVRMGEVLLSNSSSGARCTACGAEP